MLTRSHLYNEAWNVKSNGDRRKKCDREVWVYFDEADNRYHKAFESYPGQRIEPPLTGTHDEINRFNHIL